MTTPEDGINTDPCAINDDLRHPTDGRDSRDLNAAQRREAHALLAPRLAEYEARKHRQLLLIRDTEERGRSLPEFIRGAERALGEALAAEALGEEPARPAESLREALAMLERELTQGPHLLIGLKARKEAFDAEYWVLRREQTLIDEPTAAERTTSLERSPAERRASLECSPAEHYANICR